MAIRSMTVGEDMLIDRLKEWRRRRAKAEGVPATGIFLDRTLGEIARRMPKDWADLAAISGINPAKLDRYADDVLHIVAASSPRARLPGQ